ALGPENRYTAMILANYVPLLRKLNRTADAEKAEKQLNDTRQAKRELIAASTPAESASASIGIATGSAGHQGIVSDDPEPSQASTPASSHAAALPRILARDTPCHSHAGAAPRVLRQEHKEEAA